MRIVVIIALVMLCFVSVSQAGNLWNSWEIQGEVSAIVADTDIIGVCIDITGEDDFCFSTVESPPFWDHTGATWRFYKDFVTVGDCIYAAGDHVQPMESFQAGSNRAIKAFLKMHPNYCP